MSVRDKLKSLMPRSMSPPAPDVARARAEIRRSSDAAMKACKTARADLNKAMAGLQRYAESYASRARPRVVLVVEDDEHLPKMIRRVLRNVDCQLLVVDTIKDARAALTTQPVGVMMLDQNLPDGYGTDLLDEVPRSTYLILMSGAISEEMLRRVGKKARADVISKEQLYLMADTVERALRGEI